MLQILFYTPDDYYYYLRWFDFHVRNEKKKNRIALFLIILK